jgi:hypothetical protein
MKLISANLGNHINSSILSSNSLPVEDTNGTGMAKLCIQKAYDYGDY